MLGHRGRAQTTPDKRPDGLELGNAVSMRSDIVIERRLTTAARDGPRIDTVISTALTPELDPALVFGLERTFFAAMNQVWQMTILATTFFAIRRFNFDIVPYSLGTSLFIFAMLYAGASYWLFYRRLHQLSTLQRIQPHESLIWLGILILAVFIFLAMALYYDYRYPVLDRAATVVVRQDEPLAPSPVEATLRS